MSYQLNKKENYKFCRLDYAVYTKGRVSLQHILCGLCTLIISVELTKTNRDVKRTVFFSYVYTHFIDRRSFAKINNLQGVCRVLNRPYLSLTHLNSALLTCWNLTWINSRHFEHSLVWFSYDHQHSISLVDVNSALTLFQTESALSLLTQIYPVV